MSNYDNLGVLPPIDISVTRAAINGQTFDIVEYEKYRESFDSYFGRGNVAIPFEQPDGRTMILPLKGKYNPSTSLSPGVYNAGCVDFVVKPEESFVERYIPDPESIICMSNTDDIRELILKGDIVKKLDEPFITTPDNITNIPINQNDQPEMVCLKKALNAKKIDIDKYAARFGDNFPNDKRQLKSKSATLNIIKRYCANCDMEAILTLRDAGPNVPNPMNTEITVSLTSLNTEEDDTLYESQLSEPDSDDDYNF